MEKAKAIKRTPPTTDHAVEALLDQLAARTAKLVVKELEGKLILRPRLLNYEQAAFYLGFITADGKKPSVSALRQRKAAGQFPDDLFVEIGKAVRWDMNALDKWIDSQKPPKTQRKFISA